MPGIFQLSAAFQFAIFRIISTTEDALIFIWYFCSPSGFENATVLGASSLQALMANCFSLGLIRT